MLEVYILSTWGGCFQSCFRDLRTLCLLNVNRSCTSHFTCGQNPSSTRMFDTHAKHSFNVSKKSHASGGRKLTASAEMQSKVCFDKMIAKKPKLNSLWIYCIHWLLVNELLGDTTEGKDIWQNSMLAQSWGRLRYTWALQQAVLAFLFRNHEETIPQKYSRSTWTLFSYWGLRFRGI